MWTYPPAQILVPVDFGDASKRAVALAASLARRYGAGILVLHAETFEAPAYFTHEQVAVIERERMATREVARRHVAAFAGLEGVPFSVEIVQAPPAQAIVDAAHRADLIVMGTHGRRGPSRWWLGSVAERVVREAERPVLVARAGGREPVETDFLHPMMVAAPTALEGAAERYAKGLAATFGGDTAVETARCEADLARDRRVSLVVVAKPAVLGGWFGESAERMLRNCKLPMLFVPGSQ